MVNINIIFSSVLVSLGLATCSEELPRRSDSPAQEMPETTPRKLAFERFRMTGNEAGCPGPAEGDCVSAIELRSDGTLGLDPWGAPATVVLTAKLETDQLESVASSLSASEFVDLLDRKPACADANLTETMLLSLDGRLHENATGHCNEAPIQTVRGVLLELVAQHFPGKHLISPPF
jgi:hypothetical protein